MANLKNTVIDSTGFFKVPVGTESQRPSNPQTGMLRWNSEINSLENYDGTKWTGLTPIGSEINPAVSAADLVGSGSGTYFVTIHGNTYQLEFEDTDKFGTGVTGWLHISNNVIGANNNLIEFFSEATDHGAEFIDASNGIYRVGKDQWNSDGVPGFSLAEIKAPNHQYFACESVVMNFGGSNSADDTNSWPSQYSSSEINSMVADKSAVENNGEGYVIGHWNGDSNAGYPGGINLVKQGGEYGANTTATETFSGNPTDFGSVQSDPYVFCSTTDQAREYVDFESYGYWFH